MADEPIIVNRVISLNANSQTNFLEIYSPNPGFNGYVFEFLATVQISSIPQLPKLQPGDAYETVAQADYRYQELTREHPAKYLSIHISLPSSNDKILRSRIQLWNSWPPYQQDLLSEIVTGENLVLSPGTKLWIKIDDISGSGALSGSGDVVNVWLAAGELAIKGDGNPITGAIPYSAVISTNSSVILSANPNRQLATIVNRGNAIAYLNFGSTSVAGAGISLNPGGSSYTLNTKDVNYKGLISAIVASGSTVLEIMEAA